MKIAQEDIQRIVDHANIVDVIGKYVRLHKSGSNYFGCCPFHNENTASMSVSPSKRIYKCFGCDAHGNVIWFVSQIEGISYGEAAIMLAKQYNLEIKLDEKTPEEILREKERDNILNCLAYAQKMFSQGLPADQSSMNYIRSRQMADETISKYAAGSSGTTSYIQRLTEYFSRDTIIASGLAVVNDHGELRDYFYNRVTFPFFDRFGHVIGFTGRALSKEAKAKYLNSPDTMVYQKGNQLFGMYQARQKIVRLNKVYLVEGQFDVMSFAQFGITNVVCKSGSSLTDSQIKQLHYLTSNVTLIYDDDKAGIHSFVTQIPVLLDAGFSVRCVALPEGMDPDDFAKSKGGLLKEWISKNEKSFVDYLFRKLYENIEDEPTKESGLNTILDAIAHVPEESLRDSYMQSLCKLTKVGSDTLMPKLRSVKVEKYDHDNHYGFYGLEEAKAIFNKETDNIILTTSWKEFEDGLESIPVIYFNGVPEDSSIQELRKIDNNVLIQLPDESFNEKTENQEILLLKQLYRMGFVVNVEVEVNEEMTEQSFITWYVNIYGSYIKSYEPTNDKVDIFLDRMAEMMALAPEITYTRSTKQWASILGLPSEKALKDIVKPYIVRTKSKKKISQEKIDFDDNVFQIESDELPEYVITNDNYNQMNTRYGFYPLLSKQGDPVCYMFKNDGGGYYRVCDFYMEPLLHIYDKDQENNKRVIKLSSIYKSKPTYVEWKSSIFANMATFKAALINEGDYNFENGSIKQYDKIWTWMSHQFKMCHQLKTFGQQKEDFFAFANAIFHQTKNGYEISKMDNLGLVEHNNELYYSPAFSEIYSKEREDDDVFEQDRYLIYIDVPKSHQITFEYWSSLVDKVYRINDNGKWSVIYSIMCAFRSDIFPAIGKFTAIFFIGQTASGKSQVAESIRSLFEKPDIPSSNLIQISDAAFFSILERFRDVPTIFEEYNDNDVNELKFQGLKAVTYDSDGRQKRKSATSNDVVTSKVNAPVILLGQEAPQRDDNALSNRVVLCEVPAYDYKSDAEAQRIFNELKGYEREGLSYLLIQVLKVRPLFRENFGTYQHQCSKELQDACRNLSGRLGDQMRIVETISIFLATCKLLEDLVPQLKLPFTYEEFFKLGVEKVKTQVEMIARTDKLATFFNTIDYLLDKGSIKYGRDIKIEQPGKIKLKGGAEVILQPVDTRVLYMNISNVHKMYLLAMTGEKPLTLTTLEVNLKSHPAYIGNVSNTRFRWQEVRDVPRVESSGEDGAPIMNNELKRVVENREKQTSAVVLNYDILQKFMGIDFERNTTEENKKEIQTELPF